MGYGVELTNAQETAKNNMSKLPYFHRGNAVAAEVKLGKRREHSCEHGDLGRRGGREVEEELGHVAGRLDRA